MLASIDPVRAATARLTVTALSLVLGLSAIAALPLLLPWQGAATLGAISVLLGIVPFAGLALAWRRRLGLRQLLGLCWPAAGVASLVLLALLPLWGVYRAQVRVLNLGEEPFAVWVDGKRLARVEPSSGESALAGVELTLPAGPRELRVVSELGGRELLRTSQQVQGGRLHLFVPVQTPYCFFIERRAYGDSRGQPAELESEPLAGESPFWTLPDGISLFTPNPEPGPLETSGGTLASLRQRRCER